MIKKGVILFILVQSFMLISCKQEKDEQPSPYSIDLKEIQKRDTLIIGTIYGSTSYFLYRDDFMGYDMEVAQSLADKLNVNLKVIQAHTELELEQMLQDRTIDVAAYNIYQTRELKKLFYYVLPQDDSYQVLVQKVSTSMVTDITDLAGKKVYVEPNTIFEQRLRNLNKETGNSFEIVEAADSLTDEDLIEMVAAGKIDYTVAYHNTALLYKSYYRNLDIHLAVGFDQKGGWLIRHESKNLQKLLTDWEKTDDYELLKVNLAHKYWDKSLYFAQKKIRIPKGAISPFDQIFKKYATEIGWDWRLLAALAFHESRFDTRQVSWAGASGVMQLMPRTASKFGLDRQTVFDPEKNIEAGVQYIKSLNLAFLRIKDKKERIKFIIAAYNSGPAHVLDAMALAAKYGKNAQIWYNNVEYYLLKKSDPKFYNDPVVKYGRFKGTETVVHVENTLDTYERYSGKH